MTSTICTCVSHGVQHKHANRALFAPLCTSLCVRPCLFSVFADTPSTLRARAWRWRPRAWPTTYWPSSWTWCDMKRERRCGCVCVCVCVCVLGVTHAPALRRYAPLRARLRACSGVTRRALTHSALAVAFPRFCDACADASLPLFSLLLPQWADPRKSGAFYAGLTPTLAGIIPYSARTHTHAHAHVHTFAFRFVLPLPLFCVCL
jgi:hypothetical protein